MNYADWQQHFGLTRNPFRDTLETDLFFRTRNHEEAFIKARIGIADGHAIILLTGAAGTGKTLLSQILLRDLVSQNCLTALVLAYPGMSKTALLGDVLTELNFTTIPRYATERLSLLREKVSALFQQGQRLVLFIDEAHFLTADGLHLLRTLSNLETEEKKLVTVILIAENSLLRRLQSPSYQSLKSRITLAIGLSPLSLEDSEQYIKYRLLKCGGSNNLLSEQVFDTVYSKSNGVPRRINQILYNGLLEALASGKQTIDADVLGRVEIL